MSKIAVIVSNPCTGDGRVLKMIYAASEAGYDVNVFATLGNNSRPFEIINGIKFHRFQWKPLEILRKYWFFSLLNKLNKKLATGLMKRLVPFVKYNLFEKAFIDAIIEISPEIIHAHDLICLPVGYVAAFKCKAKLVYDAHELELHRNPPLPILQKLMVGYMENKYGRKADSVITVGQLVGQELAKHLKRSDINIIYNSPVILSSPRNIRSDLRLNINDLLLIYVGKVTEGRGVIDIVNLLPLLPNIFFATIGPYDKHAKARIEARAKSLGVLSRFRILPPVPSEEVVSYIRGANLGLISVEPITLSYQYCMPNKLFELAFAEIPILSNTLDEIDAFLKQFGNGMITDFNNKISLPYVIYKTIYNYDKYLLNSEKKELLYKIYSWDSQKIKLLDIYKKLAIN